jgi:hypothetical protein
MILSEATLANSSEIFAVLDPDAGGAATFSVALSPSGAANATHWGCSTYLEQRTYDALTAMNTTQFKAYCDQIAAERGRVAPNNVTAFKNGVVIGNVGEWFWDFATAEGLKPVQEQALKA